MLVCAGSLAIFDRISFSQQLVQELSTEARLVGNNCSAALAFESKADAMQTLSALKEDTRIDVAIVYDLNGKPFVSYIRPGLKQRPADNANSIIESATKFHAVEPIENKGELLGTIYIQGGDADFSRRNGSYFAVVAFMTGLAALIAVAISTRLQRVILGPIRRLVLGMNEIADNKDYSVRIHSKDKDELGQMVFAFNGMLAEIENRDRGLENRVEERTKALSAEIQIREKAQQELNKALEQANAASEAKSQFLANISHEIRTPMNGVLGMTEILLGTNLDSSQYDFAHTIKTSAEALLGIINDVLDFSKADVGKLKLVCEPMSFETLAAEISEMMSQVALNKRLQLTCWCSPAVPKMLIGDYARLRQVIVNLIGNAIKFTETGEVLFDILVESQDELSTSIVMQVKDTGVGIPPDQIQSVFESFTQADGTLTRKQGGTGLGLTISKQLVDLMGGTIEVSSEVGAGSSFSVHLKFDRISAPKNHPELSGQSFLLLSHQTAYCERLKESLEFYGAHVVTASNLQIAKEAKLADLPSDYIFFDRSLSSNGLSEFRSNFSGAKLFLLSDYGQEGAPLDELAELGAAASISKNLPISKVIDLIRGFNSSHSISKFEVQTLPVLDVRAQVLLVEDNPVNRKVAKNLLSRLGCDVSIAENGLQAIDLIKTKHFDLVWMDIQMPELNGLEATKKIRSSPDPEINSTKIIAMTANAMAGDRELCLEAGMNDYLSKPIELSDLSSLLEKWLPPSKKAA